MAISEEEKERRKEVRREKRAKKKALEAAEANEENRKEEIEKKENKESSEFPPKNCDKPRERKSVIIPLEIAGRMVSLDLVKDIHGRMTAGIGLEKKGEMVATKKVTLLEARRQLSAIQGKYKKVSGLKNIPEFFAKK